MWISALEALQTLRWKICVWIRCSCGFICVSYWDVWMRWPLHMVEQLLLYTIMVWLLQFTAMWTCVETCFGDLHKNVLKPMIDISIEPWSSARPLIYKTSRGSVEIVQLKTTWFCICWLFRWWSHEHWYVSSRNESYFWNLSYILVRKLLTGQQSSSWCVLSVSSDPMPILIFDGVNLSSDESWCV